MNTNTNISTNFNTNINNITQNMYENKLIIDNNNSICPGCGRRSMQYYENENAFFNYNEVNNSICQGCGRIINYDC